MDINPYNSPLAPCSPLVEDDEKNVQRQMRTVVRLYRWMGVIGLLGYSIGLVSIIFHWSRRGEPLSIESAVAFAFCFAAIIVFANSIDVAAKLAVKPHGMLARARLVAIILAATWFPILTVPGVICVRRVTRYFAAYCKLVGEITGDDTNANTA